MVRILKLSDAEQKRQQEAIQEQKKALSTGGARSSNNAAIELNRQHHSRHTLKLKMNKHGCGSPFNKWGFDEACPGSVTGRLSTADWEHVIKNLNGGYFSTVWPKLVWLPLVLLAVAGAVCEGAFRSGDVVPIGVLLAIFVGAGLLLSCLLHLYMRGLLRLEVERLRIACIQLSNRFGPRSVTFEVESNGLGVFVSVLVHEENVNIDIRYLPPRSLDDPTHIRQVNTFHHKSQLEITERWKPAADVPPGQVFVYGEGDRDTIERRLASAAEGETRLDEPWGGFCYCTEGSREYAVALGWSARPDEFMDPQVAAQRRDDGAIQRHNTLMFHNITYQLCPVCHKAVDPNYASGAKPK